MRDDNIFDLFHASLSGVANDSQQAKLAKVLEEDESVRQEYVNYIMLYTRLYRREGAAAMWQSKESPEINNLLQDLHEQEQQALSIELDQGSNNAKVIELPVESIKTNRFYHVYNIAVSIAAVLMVVFILYANMFPPNYSVQVATVSDQVDVKWNNQSEALETGDILFTNRPAYTFDAGYLKLNSSRGVDILIEAPASFQVLAEDRISLKYGKIYAKVPNKGIGFSIYTDSAKVIDLGTEFGVEVDGNGDTSIHVIKGKTMLIADRNSSTVTMEILKGQAKKVSAYNQSIHDIDCEDKLFVRDIQSEKNYVWHGQNSISLADIVGGGNGFNGGVLESGIDFISGQITRKLEDGNIKYGTEKCVPVTDLSYVDGVFTPGIMKDNIITSDGSITFSFPETTGYYWGNVINGAYHVGYKVLKHSLVLNGTAYGTNKNHAISMHPNLGITFDLDAIRKDYPELTLGNFKSLIGISETARKYAQEMKHSLVYREENFNSMVEFWVVIDGKKCIRKKMTDLDKAIQLDVPIGKDSRYLTLAVLGQNGTVSFCWSLFGDPKIEISFNE